jgi:anti-anti-sigma regulatory factor
MTIVDGETYDQAATAMPAVRLELDAGIARVVVGGVLTETVAAAARELLLDACEVATDVVVLDLRVILDPVDRDVLPHLVDVAHRRCWAARRRFELTVSDPEVREALAAAGIW